MPSSGMVKGDIVGEGHAHGDIVMEKAVVEALWGLLQLFGTPWHAAPTNACVS